MVGPPCVFACNTPSARCPRTPSHPRTSKDGQHCTGNCEGDLHRTRPLIPAPLVAQSIPGPHSPVVPRGMEATGWALYQLVRGCLFSPGLKRLEFSSIFAKVSHHLLATTPILIHGTGASGPFFPKDEIDSFWPPQTPKLCFWGPPGPPKNVLFGVPQGPRTCFWSSWAPKTSLSISHPWHRDRWFLFP